MILHIRDAYDTVIETVFKTEFLTLLSQKYMKATNKSLRVDVQGRSVHKYCTNVQLESLFVFKVFILLQMLLMYSLSFTVKKEGFGGGGSRQIKFVKSAVGDFPVLKPSGKTLIVSIGEGLPSNTRKYCIT